MVQHVVMINLNWVLIQYKKDDCHTDGALIYGVRATVFQIIPRIYLAPCVVLRDSYDKVSVYHFGEINEHGHGADKLRIVITRFLPA